MNNLRVQISKNLSKLGKQHADLKIKDLPLKQKSIDHVISSPYLNFDFSKQRIDKQAFDWLLTIPDQLHLRDHFSMLLDGEFDNPSENRKVSHTLYRSFEEKKGFEQIFSERNKNKTKLKKSLFPNILNNSNLDKVVTDQKNAFLQSLKKKDIPFISIELNKRDEETLGKLFSYFIFETVIMGKYLNLDPFNQPAVEGVKILTKQNLFKKNQI